MGDQTIYKPLPAALQHQRLVNVVPVINKMYHADQLSIASCVSGHQPTSANAVQSIYLQKGMGMRPEYPWAVACLIYCLVKKEINSS